MKAPKEQLKEGAALLERMLKAHDFRFKFGGSGHSSGGDFAYGAFVRKERRLEIHVRSSLGEQFRGLARKLEQNPSMFKGLRA